MFGIATKLLSRHHRTEAARYRALLRSPVEDTAESPAGRVAASVTAQASRPVLARGGFEGTDPGSVTFTTVPPPSPDRP
ncbi:hypothetical protein FHS43_000609 [Streptosporangium becharense]|uniref:Uncharacterized protein n=1 Tax=Streptosporangium becharense TaxID=1816182 RepID=A0A7W9IFQ9_9ACTN|nr:hypothetical protein [Streptosporangium becharense]MBB2909363.1 hypothetical protein [Streptosporangium becharense]MBB5819680.1 hypothetical protein [Streptosporangium becharense]